MEAKQKNWQIQHPNYVLSYSDQVKEPNIEQITFYFTIYYFSNGLVSVLLSNEKQILEKKGFIFVSPNKNYTITKFYGQKLVIKIKPELINELANTLGIDYKAGEIFFLKQVIKESLDLENLCEKIIQEATLKQVGYQLMLTNLVTQIAIILLRNHLGVRPNPHLELSRFGLVDRRLRRAIEYIHANYHQEIVLSEIADAAFLSEYHFAHLFKKITGLTPNNYLIAVRLEQAKKLLAETDESISNVSLAVGYTSQSHFTKVFRNFTGLTPAKYRESLIA